MFTSFICNEPAAKSSKDRELNNFPNLASSSSTGQLSRTACDICRAKNLECRGTSDPCNGCIASSSACTYTFSSGIGPGKKRRRKVRSPSLNIAMSQQHSMSPSSSLSKDYESGHQTLDARSEQRSNEWNHLQHVFTPTELIRDDANTAIGHTAPHASNDDWSDVSLSGDGFVLCPGKHMSPIANPAPQLHSLLHSQPRLESALRNNATSLIDPEILQMFDTPPPQTLGDAPSNFTSEMLDLTPPFEFAPKQSLSDSFRVRRDNMASTQNKASWQSCGLSSRCDCPASMSQTLHELDLQRSSGIKAVPTDTLFLSVEKGVDQFSAMLSCNKCNINDINPMLIVTHVNQLALTLSEIVHRLEHCQSPDTVPIAFRFGRYSVENTKMRTDLLIGMISLHVRCLKQLITRLEKCIADQPRLLLAGASSIVTKMQQSLEALTKRSLTN